MTIRYIELFHDEGGGVAPSV